MPIDMPPQIHERIVCSIAASVHYDVPANIVIAVAEKEAGKPGQWVRNTSLKKSSFTANGEASPSMQKSVQPQVSSTEITSPRLPLLLLAKS